MDHRPEIGFVKTDATHRVEVVGLKDDSIAGITVIVRIHKFRRGSRKHSGDGKTVRVNGLWWDHFVEQNEPISYLLPVTDAQMRKFNKSGERFAMPGQISD